MRARIYQPARNAMTSGTAKTRQWVLDFAPQSAREVDPLMGWTSINDTGSQVRLSFQSRDAAIAYAKRQGLTFIVEEPRETKRLVKSYAENFSADRKQPWTH